MPHGIDQTSGKPAIAYVGATPWHGLGERLEQGKPIETWVKSAGLDWSVDMLPVQYQFREQLRVVGDRFVVVRTDTGEPLSVVSGDYQAVQPRDILEFYRNLVSEQGYALETAGALNGGRKIWALARTGLVSRVAESAKDELHGFLLLATSFDKTLATTAAFTCVRVVCQNTLAIALDEATGSRRPYVKTEHTRLFDAEKVKEKLGLLGNPWTTFSETCNKMAQYSMEDSAAKTFFQSVIFTEKEISHPQQVSAKKTNELHRILALRTSAPGQSLNTTKATLWGAVNAITYYVDFVKGREADARLDSAWFGAGAELKEKAWQRAVSLLPKAP